jgi:hypothetical protein
MAGRVYASCAILGADHQAARYPAGRIGMAKQRLLFLCTGNSCRSQMAEGWLKELSGCSGRLRKTALAF